MGDYCNGKVLRYLLSRAEKIGFDLQLGRICIISSRKTTYFDQFGFARLIDEHDLTSSFRFICKI